jgi:hypothetical protein
MVKNERQMVRQQRRPTKKGYACLQSSLGYLNVELHCDLVPQTCENGLALARMGYYNGNFFHRSIKNFMIQVGEGWGQSGFDSKCGSLPLSCSREMLLKYVSIWMIIKGWFALLLPQATKHEKVIYVLLLLLLLRLVLLVAGAAVSPVAGALPGAPCCCMSSSCWSSRPMLVTC